MDASAVPPEIWRRLSKLIIDTRAFACTCSHSAAALKNTRELLMAASIRLRAPMYELVTIRLWDYYDPAGVLSPLSVIKYDKPKLIFHICGRVPAAECADRICAIADKTFALYFSMGILLRGATYSPGNAILYMKKVGRTHDILVRTNITDRVIDFVLEVFPGQLDVLAGVLRNSRAAVRWLGYTRGLVPPDRIVECIDMLTADQVAAFLTSHPEVDVPLERIAPQLEQIFSTSLLGADVIFSTSGRSANMIDRILRSTWVNNKCVKFVTRKLRSMSYDQLKIALSKREFSEYAIDIYHAMQRR